MARGWRWGWNSLKAVVEIIHHKNITFFIFQTRLFEKFSPSQFHFSIYWILWNFGSKKPDNFSIFLRCNFTFSSNFYQFFIFPEIQPFPRVIPNSRHQFLQNSSISSHIPLPPPTSTLRQTRHRSATRKTKYSLSCLTFVYTIWLCWEINFRPASRFLIAISWFGWRWISASHTRV